MFSASQNFASCSPRFMQMPLCQQTNWKINKNQNNNGTVKGTSHPIMVLANPTEDQWLLFILSFVVVAAFYSCELG